MHLELEYEALDKMSTTVQLLATIMTAAIKYLSQDCLKNLLFFMNYFLPLDIVKSLSPYSLGTKVSSEL